MKKNSKSNKYLFIAMFTLFFCIFLIVIIPLFIFPIYLENSATDAISILTTYKNSINLFFCAIIFYFICVLSTFCMFFSKAFKEKVIKPRVFINMAIMLFLWSGILIVMINDIEVFDYYNSINSALEQYTNGDFEYVEARIYKNNEDSKLNKGSFISLFSQEDIEPVIYYISSWELDSMNVTINKYTYYRLPEDIEFNYDEVPVSVSTGGSIRESEKEAFLEKFESADNIYRIAYTKDLNIISSIEKIN